MGIKTAYEIRCTCCQRGALVPLQRKTLKSGPGAFYYVHPRSAKGGACMQTFDNDIDTLEDLKALVPGIEIRLIGQDPAPAKPKEKPKDPEPEKPKDPDPEKPKEKEANDELTTFFN